MSQPERRPGDESEGRPGDESFLSRWSRRKHAVGRESGNAHAPHTRPPGDPLRVDDSPVAPPAAHVAPAQSAATHIAPAAPAAPVPAHAVPATPATTRSAPAGSAAAQRAPASSATRPAQEACPSTLPPVEALTFESDFSAFLKPGVDESLRRAALKKLLHDPRFNVMDGLDAFIDDYTQPSPMAPDVVRGLNHARALFSPARTRVTAGGWVEDVAEDETVQEAPPAGASGAAAPLPMADGSEATRPLPLPGAGEAAASLPQAASPDGRNDVVGAAPATVALATDQQRVATTETSTAAVKQDLAP